MNRALIILLSIFFISIGAAAQNSSISYKKGVFTLNGFAIQASEMETAIGSKVFNDTYVGAMKQRNIARSLRIGGLCSAVGGLTVIFFESKISGSTPDTVSATDAILLYAGCTALFAGIVSFDVGIPLGLMSTCRLKWIADDYNQRNKDIAFVNLGIQPHGIGISLNF